MRKISTQFSEQTWPPRAVPKPRPLSAPWRFCKSVSESGLASGVATCPALLWYGDPSSNGFREENKYLLALLCLQRSLGFHTSPGVTRSRTSARLWVDGGSVVCGAVIGQRSPRMLC